MAVLLSDEEEERVEVTVATGTEAEELGRVEVEEGMVLVLEAIEEEKTMLVVEVTKEEEETIEEETAEEDSTEEDEISVDELSTDDVAEELMAEEVAVTLCNEMDQRQPEKG